MSNILLNKPRNLDLLGFLGPVGSWTHQAALALTDRAANRVALPADELFAAYAAGRLPRICVPYHSSLVGVTPYFERTLALPRFWIERDYRRPIAHSLAALNAVDLTGIKEVIGHPVALAEVSPWLVRYLGHAKRSLVDSGGLAIEALKQRNQPDCAAVAPPHACDGSGVEVLVPAIPTDGDNVTRWWVLGPPGADVGDRWVWWRLRWQQASAWQQGWPVLGDRRAQCYSNDAWQPGGVIVKAPRQTALALEVELKALGLTVEAVGSTQF